MIMQAGQKINYYAFFLNLKFENLNFQRFILCSGDAPYKSAVKHRRCLHAPLSSCRLHMIL